MMLLYRYGAIFVIEALKCETLVAAARVAVHVFIPDHTLRPTRPLCESRRQVFPPCALGEDPHDTRGKQMLFSAAILVWGLRPGVPAGKPHVDVGVALPFLSKLPTTRNTMKVIASKVQAKPRNAGRCLAARVPYAERTELGNVAASGPERNSYLCFEDRFDGKPSGDSLRYRHSTRMAVAAGESRSYAQVAILPAVSARCLLRRAGYESGRWMLLQGYARPLGTSPHCLA